MFMATGLCFISLFKRLRSMSQDKNSAVKSFNLESPLLQPFINKVYMMKMTDIPYLTLDPTVEDALPDRGHVFHLTFPSNWKTSDIKVFLLDFIQMPPDLSSKLGHFSGSKSSHQPSRIPNLWAFSAASTS